MGSLTATVLGTQALGHPITPNILKVPPPHRGAPCFTPIPGPGQGGAPSPTTMGTEGLTRRDAGGVQSTGGSFGMGWGPRLPPPSLPVPPSPPRLWVLAACTVSHCLPNDPPPPRGLGSAWGRILQLGNGAGGPGTPPPAPGPRRGAGTPRLVAPGHPCAWCHPRAWCHPSPRRVPWGCVSHGMACPVGLRVPCAGVSPCTHHGSPRGLSLPNQCPHPRSHTRSTHRCPDPIAHRRVMPPHLQTQPPPPHPPPPGSGLGGPWGGVGPPPGGGGSARSPPLFLLLPLQIETSCGGGAEPENRHIPSLNSSPRTGGRQASGARAPCPRPPPPPQPSQPPRGPPGAGRSPPAPPGLAGLGACRVLPALPSCSRRAGSLGVTVSPRGGGGGLGGCLGTWGPRGGVGGRWDTPMAPTHEGQPVPVCPPPPRPTQCRGTDVPRRGRIRWGGVSCPCVPPLPRC